MPANRVIRVRAADSVAAETLRAGIQDIQNELHVTPDFPPEVEQVAEAAARSPRLPDLDRTDIPFVTIDPASSMDLDQALHFERAGDGYVVHYAIADLAAFVTPGDALDVEVHQRGESLYGGDSRIPLHPTVLSEGAASLLPDQVAPALLWTIELDATGERTSQRVERARVRSTAKLDYEGVQQQVDGGTATETLRLLQEIGEKRIALEKGRGGINLPLPEQDVDVEGDTWTLQFRSMLPAEDWNAQISLLTGFAAAELMIGAKVGFLRTLPPVDPRDVERLHRTAVALGLSWPDGESYQDFIRSLDPSKPADAAMTVACTRLLRGSGYAAFDGSVPDHPEHAALASTYAHVTAPLRRLGDRYASECCVAICAGQPVPDWVRTALPGLADTMKNADRKAKQYEGAVLDLVEAGVLAPRVGETFSGVVVEVEDKDPRRGTIDVQDPAVEADVSASSPLPLGESVSVKLVSADVRARKVEFQIA